MKTELKWIKELEMYSNEEKYLFFLMDISLNLVMPKIEEKTGVAEPIALYLDRKIGTSKMYVSQDDVRGNIGYEWFLNEEKFEGYLSEVDDVLKNAKVFREKMDNLDLVNVSFHEMINIFAENMSDLIQMRVLTYFTIHSYSWKIDESLRDELLETVPEENINQVLGVLTLQGERNAIEDERYEWLKEIVLPTFNEAVDFNNIKEGNVVFEKIKAHLNKYKNYPAGFDTDPWDIKYFLDTFKEDFCMGRSFIEEEFIKLRDKKEISEEQKIEWIKKYNLNGGLLKKAYILGKLGEVRFNLRVLGWSFYLYVFRKFLDLCSAKSGLSKIEIGSLYYEELLELLKNGFVVNPEIKKKIDERKKGDVLIITTPNGGCKVLLGEVAEEKFYSEIETKKETVLIEEFTGEVACRKGIVRGKVFIFRCGSSGFTKRISEFPKGSILVANLTLPLLMPAIRKSKAIVTDHGGITCHAAIVSRELGIPCIIGADIATKVLNDGDLIEVDTEKGIVKIIERAK